MGTRGKGRKVDQGANFHRVAVSRRKNCGNLDKADEWKCEIFLESAARVIIMVLCRHQKKRAAK